MTLLPLLPALYWPPVAWFAQLWAKEKVCLEACENYQKGGLRNRCYIAGPNGVQRLSIPLETGKHQQKPVREVRIAYHEAWPRQHWRSIGTAYGNAPFFEHYSDELRPYFEKRYTFLFDLNLEILHFLLRKFGWPGSLQLSERYVTSDQWPAGQDFRPEFSGDIVDLPPWFGAIPYPQVFTERQGFMPNLSALDLLFCCGKQAGEVLEKHQLLPT
ncbi:MAG: WbqC family protein [Saprospiraceae bacterium]